MSEEVFEIIKPLIASKLHIMQQEAIRQWL